MLIHFVNRIKMSAIYSTNTQSIFHVSFLFSSFYNNCLNFLHCTRVHAPRGCEKTRGGESVMSSRRSKEEVRSVCKYCVTRCAPWLRNVT